MGITIFTPAPLPLDENQRSEAAQASDLLNRTGDPHLTTIARNVRRMFDVDWCGITLIAGQTQHVIVSSGEMLGIFRRSTALSSYVVGQPDTIFVVLDALDDERFAGNPFVADGLIAFYAGAAIRDHAGYAIGALCITSRTPRQTFSEKEAALLKEFSHAVGAEISPAA